MDEYAGAGRAEFAALLLAIGGVLNVVWGIAEISNSAFFAHHQHYIFGGLKSWGWVTLILGVLELLASASLFAGGTFGRWFGILVGSLVALEALFDIPARPFWSLSVFALSLWIVYGLVVYRGSPPGVATR
jgi:hypothetical protein